MQTSISSKTIYHSTHRPREVSKPQGKSLAEWVAISWGFH
jgi:hypothetical protein